MIDDIKFFNEASPEFVVKWNAAKALVKCYRTTVRSALMPNDRLDAMHDVVVEWLTQIGVFCYSQKDRHHITMTLPVKYLGTKKVQVNRRSTGNVVRLPDQKEIAKYVMVTIDGEKICMTCEEAFS